MQYLDPINGKDRKGQATFQQQTVLVQFADGTQALLPYDGSHVQVGGPVGATPILVMLSGYNHYVRLYILERSIGDRLDPMMPPALRKKLLRLTTYGWMRPWRIVPVVAALVAAAVGVWYGSIWGLGQLVKQVPHTADVALGKQMVTAFTAGKTVSDTVVVAPVEQIAARLITHAPAGHGYAFHVTVIRSHEENAFALPGGPIMITTGLLAKSESPDEVAGILGHEMQHVLGRHTFYRISKELGLSLALSLLAGNSSVLTTIANQATGLIGLSYGREQEAESDRVGMQLAHKAGYQADALGNFFSRLQKKSLASPQQAKVLAYLSTHPAHADRLDQIQTTKAGLPPAGPKAPAPSQAWEDVKKHAASLSQTES
ncbi:MAG: M48 family metallopeptidase [Candidatus Sericytochromatia bacterium]|nr:M48 family metallopeptidase [Candidatus Sericytochromatia bacterium]